MSRWTSARGSLVCGYESNGSKDWIPGLVRSISGDGEGFTTAVSDPGEDRGEAVATVSVSDAESGSLA